MTKRSNLMKVLSGMNREDVSNMLVSAFNEVRDVMLDVKELFDETVENYTSSKEDDESVIEVAVDDDDNEGSVVSYTERVYKGDKLVSSTDKVWKNGELVVDEGTTTCPDEPIIEVDVNECECCNESKKGCDCRNLDDNLNEEKIDELGFVEKLNIINNEVDELRKTVDKLVNENERLEAENKRIRKLNEEYHEKAVKFEAIKDLFKFD